ncbi:MAG: hypothetical protein ACRDX8_08215 [Acidimicrobiales bacterium]
MVLLGIAGVAFSRYQVLHPPAPAIGDHWLVAVGFDVCGKFQPNLPKNPGKTTPGIYTTGNGLIQVAPKTKADTGSNATLGRFAAGYPKLMLSSTSLGYPGHKVLDNGALCGKTPGKVQVKLFSSLADTHGTLVKGNPASLRLTNRSLVTIAFVAPGSAIARPPSAVTLATAPTPTTTAPTVPPTAHKATTTSTTAHATTSTTAHATTSTTAHATSTTAAPSSTTRTTVPAASTATTTHR